jgi:hypothetical protein
VSLQGAKPRNAKQSAQPGGPWPRRPFGERPQPEQGVRRAEWLPYAARTDSFTDTGMERRAFSLLPKRNISIVATYHATKAEAMNK